MYVRPQGIRSKLTSTVSGLCDDRLLEQTGKLARLDHQVHVFLIDHLCEIEARRLYLRRGFSSLFDYVKRGLGYSDAATWRRINAMELCTRIEGVRERLWDGSLALDAAAQLQAAFKRRERERTPEARGTGRGSAVRTNGSPRPASSPSAQGKPAPTLRPGPVLDRSAQKALVEQATGKSTREVAKLLADVYPALAVPADRVRPLGEGHWELKAVIDADCQRGLEQLRGLLSHIDPRMTLGQLVGRLVKEGLDRHDPGRPPRRRTRTAPTGADRPPAGQGESPDRNRASENNRSTRDAGATTSAPKAQSTGSGRSVPSPAQRRAQPAAAVNSPANRQPNADRHVTSAPKRTERTGVTSASASKTERDSNRRASSAPKRSAKTDANYVSGPHTELDSDGREPAVASHPARPVVGLTSAPKKSTRTGRAMPTAVRREVWQRDMGRCRYVDPRTGRRCASRHLLQIDHVFPYALGGVAEPDNLRLLCFAHHRDRHAERTSRRGPPA